MAKRRSKYKSEEEAKAAQRAQQKAWRAANGRKKGGKGKSWLNSLAKKLDAASETTGSTVSSAEDATPPDRPGEPFADLPPLDLPGTSAESAPSEEKPDGSSEPTADTSSPKASADSTKARVEEKQAFLNTEQIAEMAEGMVKQGTLKLGEYAAERGFFALGEFFAELAGKSAAIIVRANATKWDVAPEEAAAWVVVGVAGTNSVQAFRAYRADRLKEEEAKHAAPAVKPAHVNGAAPVQPEPPRQQPPNEERIIVRPGSLV